MIMQAVLGGPAQSTTELAIFGVAAVLFACYSWLWFWRERRRGSNASLWKVLGASIVFLGFAIYAFRKAVS